MRTIAATLILGFGVVILAHAQDKPAGQKPAGEHSMTGCVEKGTAANTFRLTNVEKVKTVDIAESKTDLAPHVGHKVEITGTAIPGKETHTMNISAVKMVSTTCP